MKKIKLNINHPNKARAEAFLSSINEELETVPFDWKSLKQSTRIVDSVKLTDKAKTITITLIFTDSYGDPDIIVKANEIKDSIRWGYNGSIMYLVESSDSDKVDKVVSAFAGKE